MGDTLAQAFTKVYAVVVGALAISLGSGGVVGLVYEPSTLVMRQSRAQLYHAKTAIVDRNGDTLLVAGERVLLDSIPPHTGIIDTLVYDRTGWTPSRLSHILLMLTFEGRFLQHIHAVGASVIVIALVVMLVLAALHGQLSRWERIEVLLLLVTVMSSSWLGTCLPVDNRAMAAYEIGRTFLADNLPVLGDGIALLLPETLNTARVLIIHAIWMSAAVVVLAYHLRRSMLSRRVGLYAAFSAVSIVVVAVAITLLSEQVYEQSVHPIWHLSVVWWLAKHLPMDFVMLLVIVWWGAATWLLVGRSTWEQQLGASIITCWFCASGIVSVLFR